MNSNEQLAHDVVIELQHAIKLYMTNVWTAEQFLNRIKNIVKAANLS